MQREDDGLKEAFQGLRAETAQTGRVPEFGSMLQDARRRADARPALEVVAGGQRGGMRVAALISTALAAAVAGLIIMDRGPTGDDDFERLVAAYVSETAGGTWGSPTSGLLEVPGSHLVRSLPSIGAPVRGLDPSTLPPRPPSPEEENP